MRHFHLYVTVIVWLGVILSFSACREDEPEEKIFLNIELNELPERTALKYIDDSQKLIGKSQELNFKRWDIMNVRVSVGGIPMGSFDKEVECDRQFFINRINWLNGELSKY